MMQDTLKMGPDDVVKKAISNIQHYENNKDDCSNL